MRRPKGENDEEGFRIAGIGGPGGNDLVRFGRNPDRAARAALAARADSVGKTAVRAAEAATLAADRIAAATTFASCRPGSINCDSNCAEAEARLTKARQSASRSGSGFGGGFTAPMSRGPGGFSPPAHNTQRGPHFGPGMGGGARRLWRKPGRIARQHRTEARITFNRRSTSFAVKFAVETGR